MASTDDVITCPEVSLADLARHIDERLDRIDGDIDALKSGVNTVGTQNNWLIDNLQQVFSFVTLMGQNGGGIRGMMKALKHAPPELLGDTSPVTDEGA